MVWEQESDIALLAPLDDDDTLKCALRHHDFREVPEMPRQSFLPGFPDGAEKTGEALSILNKKGCVTYFRGLEDAEQGAGRYLMQ